MGNSADNRVNLLAKNWIQVNSNTYKNTITQEIIDSYELESRNEEELSYNNSLLIKRAAINHSNVLKLIYFYQEQQSVSVCNNKKFKHKIYTQHATGTLASLIGVERNEGNVCYCCSVMSGIGCLVDKYGYFGVSPTMIFMVNSVGLSRLEQKKTPKVWINQDLKINHTEQICNEQEMCFHLFQLFQLLVQRELCTKIDVKEMNSQKKFKDFFQYIFRAHKKQPVEERVQRKRITSQLNGFEDNKMQKTLVFAQSNLKTHTQAITNINAFPTYNSSRQSLLHRVNNSFNFPDKDHINKERISQMDTTQQTLFMKKQGQVVKQVDLQNRSFQKIQKSKVNFSYTDSLATPKNNKSFYQNKTAKLAQSPHQELASVNFRSINNKNQGQVQKMAIRRQALPVVSFFNSNPKNQTILITKQIEKSPYFNSKSIEVQNEVVFQAHSEVGKNQSEEKKLMSKPCQITKQTNFENQQLSESLSHSKETITESKVKKQNNLKLQKCVDLHCVLPQESKKSIGLIKQKNPGVFQIAKQYCLSIEPEVKLPSIRIDQSEQFVSESIQLSSGKNLREKADNLTSNYHRESHLQREESITSENINFISNNFVHSHVLKQGSSRKGSLPAPQHTLDKKYNNYVHKLEHFSKNIANSINSNGTKRSLPQQSYEIQVVNENQLRAANMDNREYLGNKLSVQHNKRQMRNRRSSDIESYYSESDSLDERKKVQILQKISKTQKILQENKKKLEKLQLEKDLEIEKDMIKKQMESLLKNNMMVDESHRIKEKVRYKKATFAELKAQASKILNDLSY